MADFAPHAAQNEEQEHADDIARNTRYGLILFAVYLALYVGFLLLSTFAAQMMQEVKILGVNLSIIYGFTLILAALVLALIYGWLCRSSNSATNSSAAANEEGAAK